MGAQYDNLGNYIGYQNDDGTWWAKPDGAIDQSGVRPDLVQDWKQQGQTKMSALSSNPAFTQFTPAQVAAFQSHGGSPAELAAMVNSWAPFQNYGVYNDTMYGGQNMWFGPEAGPQHNDTGMEQAQTAWNDMRNGLAIMALPFAGYGISAAVGAGTAAGAGAGAAGAGAAEGGAVAGGAAAGSAEAGAGSYGLGEAYGGMAAPEAGGAAGATISGGTGSATLAGGAGSDTVATTSAADASSPGFDPGGEGMYNVATNSSNTLFPNGMSATDPSFMQQAQEMAKQLGITPQSALQWVLKAAGRAAPAALGVAGSLRQQDQFQRLSDQYSSYGAPYRERLAGLYADPNSFLKSADVTAPVQQASDIAAHSLSMGGNPVASGNSLQQLQDYSANQLFGRLGQEKDRLAGFGGLTQYNAAAPGAATNAINAGSNVFNALGAGAANIFNPPQTLAQQMAEFQRLSSGAVR